MNLNDFLNGIDTHPSTPDVDHVGVAATLAGEIHKMLGGNDIKDRDAVRAAADLGIFELFEEGEKEGFTQLLYLETLRHLARFAPTLARFVAGHHHTLLMEPGCDEGQIGFPAWEGRLEMVDFRDGNFLVSGTLILDVNPAWLDFIVFPTKKGKQYLRVFNPGESFTVTPIERPGQVTSYRVHLVNLGIEPKNVLSSDEEILNKKNMLDYGVQVLGTLDAAVDLAAKFADERELFRKKLSENSFIQASHQSHRIGIARNWSGLLHQAALVRDEVEQDGIEFVTYALARNGLDRVSDLMQLCGGTGYMHEFGMPDHYLRVLHLTEVYAPPVALCDEDLVACLQLEHPAEISPLENAASEQLRIQCHDALTYRRPKICNQTLDKVMQLYLTSTMDWHLKFLAVLDEPSELDAWVGLQKGALAEAEVTSC